MHDVMIKTFELIDELDKSDMILNISKYKDMIYQNDKLRELIDKGNHTDDKYILMDIKNKLYQYPEYREYMHYYNEIMYIVMDINNRYKKLLNERRCINK